MKILTLILAIGVSLPVFSQENASDYMLPVCNAERHFYKVEKNTLKGELTELDLSSSGFTRTTVSNYRQDGSVGYKFIHHTEGLFSDEDYAYFLSFSGNTASLFGHSKYLIDGEYQFLQTVYNEAYTDITPVTFCKIPNESYQSVDWTYTNPETKKQVSASSYYKNLTIGGKEKRILIIETIENYKTVKSYYMKYFGLIAVERSGEVYLTDFDYYLIYNTSFIDNTPEKDLRKLGWDIMGRLFAINTSDSFMRFGDKDRKSMMLKLDSLQGLYEHMYIKFPEMQNVYRYIMAGYIKTAIEKMFNVQNENKTLYMYSYELMPLYNTYYLLRPYPEFISKYNLSTYVSKVDELYYKNFWQMDYMYLSTLNADKAKDQSYLAYLMKPRIDCINNNENNIDNINKCLLYSIVAIYHKYRNEPASQYLYYVKSVENYKFLSQADKDINIDYMRNVMRTLSTLIPGSESDLNRAIDATLSLKDYNNSVKIASNGYQNKVGTGMLFALKYAEAAYNDDLNKENLRNAMRLLDGKYPEMTTSQLSDYIKYCKAMSPEFDCSKAESDYSKVEKREKQAQEKKDKESKKKYSSGGSERAVNLALQFNPFAGLNISGNGGIFKFLPMSASLRTKGIVHEFRYNPFFGFNAKNRFVAGKITENDVSFNDGWKNIKGADYGYSFIVVKNDYRSYSKTVNSAGMGLNVIYGKFTTDEEVAQATINGISSPLILRPVIQRYEALVTFNWTTFSWKSHLSGTVYYGFGAGMRDLTYGNYTFSQEILADKDKTVFSDKRFVQTNWTGPYFTFRTGFRLGFTIF
jgi:hypothetical protein